MVTDTYILVDISFCQQAAKKMNDIKESLRVIPLRRELLRPHLARFFTILKPHTDPPEVDLPHPNFWYALNAIEGFNYLLGRFPDPPHDGMAPGMHHALALVYELLADKWEDVWKWVESGTRRALLQENRPLPSKAFGTLVRVLCNFTELCSLHDGLRHRVFTKGYDAVVGSSPACAMNDWLQERDQYTLTTEEMESQLKRIVERLRVPASEILLVLLSRFLYDPKPTREPLEASQFSRHPIIHYVHFLIAISEAAPARNILTVNHSIYYFTRRLVHASYDAYTKPKLRSEHIQRFCQEQMCVYLRENFRLTHGITWLRRSLEAGLILAILRCAPRSADDPSTSELCNLVTFITQYFVYISVLRVVARSMKSLDIRHLESDIYKGGPFWEAWTVLKQIYEERLEISMTYLMQK
ncbi:hypothetical protein H0H81_001634, partial [Sphagnurus paluster]